MNLTAEQVKRDDQELASYYSAWHAKCDKWLGYLRGESQEVKVKPPLTSVFPPVARRVIYGLAQQIHPERRRVHCPPARNAQGRETAEAQARSSTRETFHRIAFAQDAAYALRNRRYPPGHGMVIEMLLFGLSAAVVLPNELALGPEPERRAGEAGPAFERRRRFWEARRLLQPALPGYLPGILNVLIDPSGDWFIWRFTLPTARANDMLKRWGQETVRGDKKTVAWKEAYSDEKRLVFCEDRLVYEGEGYGMVPLATALPVKGEPAIYDRTGTGSPGPEYQYAGLLAGCESILEDINRKETQIANHIRRRIWPKSFWHGDSVPEYLQSIDWDPAKREIVPSNVSILQEPVADLPNDIWQAVEHAHSYIDSLTQIDAMQGYRQAESGYQEALLGGMAAAVLHPYILGLDLAETAEAEVRNLYIYLADLLPEGVEIGGWVGGKWTVARVGREDMDSLVVEVTHEARLPQQRITEFSFWRDAYKELGISRRTAVEEGVGIEDPEAEYAQRMGEDWVDSPEVQAIKRRDFAYSYDADLARRLEETQAPAMEQLIGAIQGQQGMAAPTGQPAGQVGGRLGQPGTALGTPAPIRVAGQPTAVTPEIDAELIARQARRRAVPAGRRR